MAVKRQENMPYDKTLSNFKSYNNMLYYFFPRLKAKNVIFRLGTGFFSFFSPECEKNPLQKSLPVDVLKRLCQVRMI